MAELEINMYDVNKSLSAQERSLTNTEIRRKIKEIIIPYITSQKYNKKYFMLLCRELYDFTLFNFSNYEEKTLKEAANDFFECFINRGKAISIDLITETQAIEIWLRETNEDKEEDFVYYLFPYDRGVIEV